MNDHHFTHPVVVPLRGATISGHATQSPAPIGSLQAEWLLQPSIRQPVAAPAPKVASQTV